jgi:hypothetical protein
MLQPGPAVEGFDEIEDEIGRVEGEGRKRPQVEIEGESRGGETHGAEDPPDLLDLDEGVGLVRAARRIAHTVQEENARRQGVQQARRRTARPPARPARSAAEATMPPIKPS